MNHFIYIFFANIVDFEKHRESQSKRMLMLMSAFLSMESMRISVHCNFLRINFKLLQKQINLQNKLESSYRLAKFGDGRHIVGICVN